MDNFNEKNLGKKFKNKTTGEITTFVGRSDNPSAIIKHADNRTSQFVIGSYMSKDWELFEESLSDKRRELNYPSGDGTGNFRYKEEDVKEFIKKLIKDEHINSSGEASKRIRKYAGDKLR